MADDRYKILEERLMRLEAAFAQQPTAQPTARPRASARLNAR